MSGNGKKHKKHEDHEEHENHERWLVTYADMVTLLFVLFVVLFSMATVDQKKFEQLASSLAEGFGSPPSVLSGNAGLLELPGTTITQPDDASAPQPAPADSAAAAEALRLARALEAAQKAERESLEKARQAIAAALQAKGLQDSARIVVDERGLTITIVTDEVLFDLGQADIRPKGREVLDAVTPALVELPNPITVEGHTDNLPISTSQYPSNWELSGARAASVLRYMIGSTGLPARRVGSAGYADQRPLQSNATAAGRSVNRRVQVIVQSIASVQVPTQDPASNRPFTGLPTGPTTGIAPLGG